MIPYTATKHLVNATKEQQTTENDLRIIAENSAIRNRKEVHKYQKEIDNYIDKSEELEEDVAARETINQLLGTLSSFKLDRGFLKIKNGSSVLKVH